MNTTLQNTTTWLPLQSNRALMYWKRARSVFATLFIVISFVSYVVTSMLCETAVEASSQQVKLLELPLPTGSIPQTLTFPVYEQESIQYFSAGLGKEERSLSYPPFPLKLIFVEGERAYLTGVSIHLTNEDGTLDVTIPQQEVEGPWLFINAPIGTYTLMGTDSHGTNVEKTITIQPGKQTTVHFRFP